MSTLALATGGILLGHVDELEDRVGEVETGNEQLRERNEELEARLRTVEDHLGLNDATNQSAPVYD